MKHIFNLNILSTLLIAVSLLGCSASRSLRTAKQSYEIGEYHKSIQQFQKAARQEKDLKKRLEYDKFIADAYWHIGDYRRAGLKYKNLVARNISDSLTLFRYADALRNEEKYDDARKVYLQLLDSFPSNQQFLNGHKSCEMAPVWKAKPTRHVVERERTISSRDADFGPVFVAGLDNNLVFTSTREGSVGRRKSAITGQRNGDLFQVSFDIQKQRWVKPVLIDEEQLINTTHDEGAATLTNDGSQIYFTRCRFDKRAAVGAEIFTAKKSRDAWSEATKMKLASDSLIAAHPSISSDGQTLYFVSDMEGGYGGTDIWKVEQLSGDWGSPENLGPEINTPGNEMYPFIRDNGELYFSSDFHPGLGGLDIFRAHKTNAEDGKSEIWKVENMQVPINSSGDDFSIAFLPGKEQGMFASNRKGAMGDDLFSFVLPPKLYKAEGEIVNFETENRESNVNLRIIGTDGTMLKVRSTDGKFQFRLQPNTEYIFAAFKDGFLNAKAMVSTVDLEDSKNFNLKLMLTPTDAPIKVDNINYEFGKFDLLPSSMSALDSLVELLNTNPTIVAEIMAHTDHVGTLEYNSNLSQKRAQSVVDYLIKKGINPNRLVAKGYGETWPKKVTEKLATLYPFLKRGDELTESFVNSLPTEEQKQAAMAINRRTEFRVLRNDFIE